MTKNMTNMEIIHLLDSLTKNDIKTIDILLPLYSDYVNISIPKRVLRKQTTRFFLDTVFGFIKRYSTNLKAIPHGTQFKPVHYIIQELKKKYPKEKTLDFIRRKTAYIELLEEDMKYLSNRFIWKRVENIEEIFINKFETIVEHVIELVTMTINTYQNLTKTTMNKVEKLEDIVQNFFMNDTNIPRYYRLSYNVSLNYIIYIHIRNMLVHNVNEIQYKINFRKTKIIVKDIPSKRRKGLFNDYLVDLYTKYKGKKIASSYINIKDYRFPYLKMKLKLTKKCTLNKDESIISFEMELLELVKKMLNDLFRLESDILNLL